MTYHVTWHGGVCDVEYEVDADTEDEAKHKLCLYLHGEDVEGVRPRLYPVD